MKQFVLLLAGITLAGITLASCTDSEPQNRTFQLDIQELSLDQGMSVLQVTQGDEVTIVVATDQYISFHLHGYDIRQVAKPNEPATLRLTANATGTFPFTIHASASGDEDREKHAGKHEHRDNEEITLGRIEVHPR